MSSSRPAPTAATSTSRSSPSSRTSGRPSWWGGALFLGLSFWNIDVTPLLASAGVVGIVVGLAARDTIANFFGSIALYADGTYTVGDYVVLESGQRGRVEDISVRSTVIRTRDDILVTIPNAELNKAAVVNESTPRRYRRVRIPVSVAYGTDVDEVEDIMLGVAEAADLIRKKPNPRVRLREFGDSGLQVELLAWIDHPRLRGRAVDKLMRAVYTEFREAGVEIPYPQREVRMLDDVASGGGDGAGVSVESLDTSD
ncbi:mechanosensitive ion channel family protein [Halobacteriales archaeon Cl-PHB]